RFALRAQPALIDYMRAHDGAFPARADDIKSYFKLPIDDDILQRFQVVPASDLKHVHVGGAWAITQATLVDPDYDHRFVIGPDGWGTSSAVPSPDILNPVTKAWSAAHPGMR